MNLKSVIYTSLIYPGILMGSNEGGSAGSSDGNLKRSLWSRCVSAVSSVVPTAAPVSTSPRREEIQLNFQSADLSELVGVEGVSASAYTVNERMMPRGSAVLTSSGKLAETGITQIIHAASGSSGSDHPDVRPALQGVEFSVKNSLTLAQKFGHKRVAVPFIGGAIFAKRIGVPPNEIAELIVRTALTSRNNLEVVFMTFGDDATMLFTDLVAKVKGEGIGADRKVDVINGDITKFSVHGASAIVNAANTEIRFGAGVSGAIARATGQDLEIDLEAEAIVKHYNSGFQSLVAKPASSSSPQ